jgi:hypothetical protein
MRDQFPLLLVSRASPFIFNKPETRPISYWQNLASYFPFKLRAIDKLKDKVYILNN